MKIKSCFNRLALFILCSCLFLSYAELVKAQNFASGEILGENGDGYGLSFAFKSENTPAFAFFNINDSKLKYLERADLYSLPEIVDSSLQSPSDTALVIKNSTPNIFYLNQQNQPTRAYKENGSWIKQVISPTDTALGNVSASICGNDICVSFYNSSQKKIKVAKYSNNSWQIMTPDNTSADIGVMNDITQNNSGYPVVVYFDATNKKPKVATLQSGGSWTVETITYLNDKFGINPSVAVDSSGNVYVVSSRYRSLATSHDIAVYYSRKLVGESWATVEISQSYEGGPTDITIDSNNVAQVAYRHLQYNPTYGNFSDVRIGSVNNGGFWKQSAYKADLPHVNLVYDIEKISLIKDQFGSMAMAFGFSRVSYDQNPALMAIMYYGPEGSSSSSSSQSTSSSAQSSSSSVSTPSSSSSSSGNSSSSTPPSSGSSSSSSQPTTGSSSSSGSSSSAAPSPETFDDLLDPDFDGLSNFQERQYGTNPLLEDTDGDGVGDGQEVIDGTNPRDKGSALAILGTKLCTEWNGFVSDMDNIYELTNISQRMMRVQVTLYQSNGSPSGRSRIRIMPGAQNDVLVHDMRGMLPATSGRVCAEHDGVAGDLDGRMVYYKKADLESNGDYQFAIAMPASNGKLGEQFVTVNTFQPGFTATEQLNPVENWIQLTNLSASPVKGILSFYSQTGKILKSYSLTLAAGVRRDFAGHQFGQDFIGMARWKPERLDLPVLMRNIRYVFDNPLGIQSYSGAAQFEGGVGTGQLMSVPLDTRNGSSILEVANTKGKTIRTEIAIYSEKGSLIKKYYFYLSAYASKHVITDAILGANKIGVATIKSNVLSSAMATMMHYQHDLDGSLAFMYAMPAEEALGTVLNGSYNTYLNHQNLLVVSNPTSLKRSLSLSITRYDGKVIFGSKTTRVSYVDGQALVVPAHGVLVLDINQLEESDKFGVIRVQSSSSNSIVAWVLRQRANEYLMPVPVRQ